ncbi:hypothetical protein ACFYOR_09435 [Streptomyces griseofuscus]|uniref:hypothetical protein n=1 Tax=Streptomyces griseofuscus TaxID=146922 RepID=UPI003685F52B
MNHTTAGRVPPFAAALSAHVARGTVGQGPPGSAPVESAPSVVAELARRIALITSNADGRQVPAVSSVDHLTAEGGRAIIAENRAAYIAEYGEPALATRRRRRLTPGLGHRAVVAATEWAMPR